ncbi:GDSL-type esterase/lipase family protein [Aquipuribacter sp. SD81]|uniref:GDSL-type esterase/lipase family protein n=1 Tax=Aquipuribacter sp. SD81 TaxID=3127703 RepID=UPI003019421B
MADDRQQGHDGRDARVDVALCVLGDELVAGRGDARALGWVGRVVARTPQESFRITSYPLAVPGETTTGTAARWEAETAPRLGERGRLVLAPGRADAREGVTVARSRLNVANVVDAAQNRGLPVMVVGPPPVLPDGPDAAHARAVGELSAAYADVCDRRRVPYVDTHGALRGHEDWLRDVAASDGRVPGQAGYGLLAYLVLHGGWYAWWGVEPPA